jgi:Zn-dependent peptidase ImmA (M78 family)/transcriptional regulator with XRE-family HTH domain
VTVGTIGFVASRLRQAREARGLSVVALAELAGVSAAAISQYEKGHHLPRIETSEVLAKRLNLPLSYFLKPEVVAPVEQHRLFYRSMSSATKQARTRAGRRLEWFKEIVAYFEQFFDFPEPNIPDFGLPDDFREITRATIESAAEQLRAYWRLGMEPIADVIRTMEANGIYVSRGSLDAETLDAFSEFDGQRPYVFLNGDKNVLVRSRFDCAHELGHLVLHRNVKQKDLNRATDFKIIESQAHHFAGAFLFPARSFQHEIWALSLDSFRSLKPTWKVSIAAMISRASQLEILDEEETKRLWINLSRRGWRQREPLDDLPCEQPKMLAKAADSLIKNKIKTREQIIADLAIPHSDIVELLGDEPELFREGDDSPRLKTFGDNVIRFRR